MNSTDQYNAFMREQALAKRAEARGRTPDEQREIESAIATVRMCRDRASAAVSQLTASINELAKLVGADLEEYPFAELRVDKDYPMTRQQRRAHDRQKRKGRR